MLQSDWPKCYNHGTIMDTSVVNLTALRLTGAARFITSQQLRVFLFPYTTNTFEAAAKV